MRLFMVNLLIAVLSVSASATIYTVTDGYFTSKTVDNYDTLIMSGGGAGSILGRGNGILDIRNTSSPYVSGESGINYINLNDDSQLYFSGGSLHLLGITGDASVVLSGGQIDEINSYYYSGDLNHITIYCQPGWTYENYHLSGQWLDATPFNIYLYSQSSTGVFDNITFIPEPATLSLFALGGLMLRRKR